jgi:hypothetical protein
VKTRKEFRKELEKRGESFLGTRLRVLRKSIEKGVKEEGGKWRPSQLQMNETNAIHDVLFDRAKKGRYGEGGKLEVKKILAQRRK